MYRWWVLGITTLVQLTAALASLGIGAWGPYAKLRWGLSDSHIGLLAATANGATIAGLFLLAPRLDRIGERRLISGGLLVLALAMGLLGTCGGPLSSALIMLMIGAGYTPIQPAGGKAVFQWFPARQRGLAMGVRQAALPLGGAVAAAVIPPLIDGQGWNGAMLWLATAMLACALLFGLSYRPAAAAAASRSGRGWIALWRAYGGDPGFRQVAAIGCVLVAAQTALSLYWMLFLMARYHHPLAQAARALLLLQAAGTLGRLGLAAASDHVAGGRKTIVFGAGFGMTALLLILSVLPAWPPGLAGGLLTGGLGFIAFGWYAPWLTWVAERADASRIGEALGLAMAINQIAIAAAPLACALLLRLHGGYTPVWAGLSALVATGLGYGWYQGRSGKVR